MARDVNSPSGDEEEFQFSELEESHPTSMHENVSSSTVPGNSGGEGGQKRKTLLVVIGLIVGVFCIYKLYGLFTATSTRAIKAPLAGVKFEETKNPTTSPKTEGSKFQTTQASSTSTDQTAEQKNVVKLPDFSNSTDSAGTTPATTPTSASNTSTNLNTENSSTSKALNLEPAAGTEESTSHQPHLDTQKLEKSQENLQTQISGLSSAISEIQNNISMLTQQVNKAVTEKNTSSTTESKPQEQKSEKPAENKSVTQSENQIENKTQSKTVCVPQKIHHHLKRHVMRSGSSRYPRSEYATKRQYYVRSMVQNRAWIYSGPDDTLTISPGDMLLGYGRILDIDTDDGLVKTSSGKTIQYLPQDR